MNRRRTNWPARKRGGVVLFAVVVVITIAAILFGSLLKTSFGERFVVQSQQYAEQSAALAASGIERAAARLQADPGDPGENWQIPAASLDGRHDAVVEITVEPLDDSGGRRIRVQADFPRRVERRMRHTLEVNIANPQERNDP